MSHIQQQEYCKKIKQAMPFYFINKIVLDIGSLDINGSNADLFDNCLYFCLDIGCGRNVDIVSKAHELYLPDNSLDTIISTECFEHDQFYELTLKNTYRMLKPGGFLIFTCATTGRAEHGTRKSTPEDAPLLFGDEWSDYYKNLTENDIRNILNIDKLFSEYRFEVNEESHDLYFWGIKTGEYTSRDDYSFLVNKNKEMKHKDEIIEAKNIEAGSLHQQIESLRYDIECNANEIKLLSSDIKSILNSKSWKITKPMRIIFGWFKSK